MLPHHEAPLYMVIHLKPLPRGEAPLKINSGVRNSAPVFIARVLKNKLTSQIRQNAQKALYRFVESFIYKLIDKGLFL